MNWTIKIDRAKQHMEELKSELKLFFSSSPYRISTKREPQTGRLIYYITEAKIVPEKIALISGDIIQNLRSALDHLAYELFILKTKGTSSGHHIYFPIEDDVSIYKKEKDRKTKGISQSAKVLIDFVKPYKGGNDILWQINELNNIDKHRLLITVGSSFRSVDLGAHLLANMKKLSPDHDFPTIPLFVKPADILFPLEVGDELFSDGQDAEVIPNMQFQFELVLNEQGVIEGKPLAETLQSMIVEVEKLIPIFTGVGLH